jgi:hypothetical protein
MPTSNMYSSEILTKTMSRLHRMTQKTGSRESVINSKRQEGDPCRPKSFNTFIWCPSRIS